MALWQVWGPNDGVRAAPVARPLGRPSSASPSPARSGPTGVAVAGRRADPGPINTAFPGITTFRGNATRDYYGEGPVPRHPVIRWSYPESGELCSTSSDAAGSRVWCGTGWTGQPNVIVHEDGRIEIREGAYDAHYHFLNGRTGRPMRPDLVTGDLAKGSATLGPRGIPAVLRGLARQPASASSPWTARARRCSGRMNADTTVSRPLWNNDWDGAALVLGDYLLEGGENSWFYVVKINRGL